MTVTTVTTTDLVVSVLETPFSVPNLRDLASASPRLTAGKLIRCAMPSYASIRDADVLLNSLGIRDMVDLRSSEELRDDPPSSPLFERAHLKRWERHWVTGQVYAVGSGPAEASVVRHNVSLLERMRFYMALLWNTPIVSVVTAAAMGVVDRERSRQVMLREVNEGGLRLLYKIILESAKPELSSVMHIVLEALEQRRPLLFFCKAGKDRTGVVAMLILTCCGCSDEEIVADYVKSAAHHKMALAGIENKPELKGLDRSKFEGAPAEAMWETLSFVRARYGSVPTYLTSIGFGRHKQRRLAELLMADG